MVSSSVTKETRIYNGEKTVSSVAAAGKTEQPCVKNETRTLPNTICKSKLKMDLRPRCKAGHYKIPRRKHRKNSF